jgi:hypothetical protein
MREGDKLSHLEEKTKEKRNSIKISGHVNSNRRQGCFPSFKENLADAKPYASALVGLILYT